MGHGGRGRQGGMGFIIDGGGKGGWKLLKADAPGASAFFLYSSNLAML